MLQAMCNGPPCKPVVAAGIGERPVGCVPHKRGCSQCHKTPAFWWSEHECGCVHFFCGPSCMVDYESATETDLDAIIAKVVT